jgi:hypothetical protein
MRQEIGVKLGFTLVVLAPKKVGDLARYDGFKADLTRGDKFEERGAHLLWVVLGVEVEPATRHLLGYTGNDVHVIVGRDGRLLCGDGRTQRRQRLGYLSMPMMNE